ncbi:phosphoadenylyl-sulfate reductase [Fervidibacillus albus]|uniref:Adenosine 5'-phosphosulfate reductase n=2 Tax=Fervidibacillus albus TaxID=2980026 RepID=A0A9E8LX36_9BACI|nr:phosphoadenylyl-sulfate reductase [Fervidibacillus albus]
MDVLKWAFQQYGEQIIYACSFGAEGIVLIDLISKISTKAKVVFLDTGLHFPETYELIERVKNLYPNIQLTKVTPKWSVQEQAERVGDKLWKTDPNRCCYFRKVEPLQRTLTKYEAWISGIRKEQSLSRQKTEYINKDEKFQKIKICPLIHWTWEDVLRYIQLNHLPYNPLHDQGFPSIGCAPCTLPVESGADFRSGRWKGFAKTECGIHQNGNLVFNDSSQRKKGNVGG